MLQILHVDAGEFENKVLIQENFTKAQLRIYRRTYRLFFVTISTSIVLVTINHVISPKGLTSIYSLLLPLGDNLPLQIFSLLLRLFFLGVIWLGTSLYELITFGFAESMTQCLKIISFQSPVQIKEPTDLFWIFSKEFEHKFQTHQKSNFMYETTIRYDSCIENYRRVQLLVQQFNALFSNVLFILKAMNLINLCVLLYIPLQEGSHKSAATNVMLFVGSVSIIHKLYLVLNGMTSVYKESIEFRQSWVKALPYLSQAPSTMSLLNRDKLKFLSPIKFQSGIFYDILPNTLLSFFSITTTYIIVLQQI